MIRTLGKKKNIRIDKISNNNKKSWEVWNQDELLVQTEDYRTAYFKFMNYPVDKSK